MKGVDCRMNLFEVYIQGASKKSVISDLQLYTTISQVRGHSQRCLCTQNKAVVMQFVFICLEYFIQLVKITICASMRCTLS